MLQATMKNINMHDSHLRSQAVNNQSAGVGGTTSRFDRFTTVIVPSRLAAILQSQHESSICSHPVIWRGDDTAEDKAVIVHANASSLGAIQQYRQWYLKTNKHNKHHLQHAVIPFSSPKVQGPRTPSAGSSRDVFATDYLARQRHFLPCCC